MKDFLEDLREAFAMTIAAIVIPLAAILVVTIVYAVMLRDGSDDYARCKTLQGEYGGGKCFKDGKEI